MSHPEQLGFFALVAEANPALLIDGSVIEIGSYDVNGGVRKIFTGVGEYVGVDLTEGPGVDEIGFGHEVTHPDGRFDAAISGECFEHDPHWPETFQNMVRMTRPGGLVAFTCASTARPEHGTRRSDLTESPGTQAEGLDYYRNLTAELFRSTVPLDDLFESYEFWYLPTSFDLYFAGIRAGTTKGNVVAVVPHDRAVTGLRRLMNLPHRVVRLPLKVAVRLFDEYRYQSVILPYWRGLLKVQDFVAGGRFRRAEHR